MRRMTRSLLFLTSLVVAVATGGRDAVATAQHNVVLFIADDMSQDAGCYGNPVVQTPNLDALASAGTLFSYAFANAAGCSQSRAAIMTGLQTHTNAQYGLAHDVHNFHSLPGTRTLPILMREAGYRTARIGRVVHVNPPEMYAFDLTLPPLDGPLTLERRLYGRDVIKCVADARQFITADDSRPFFLMLATCDAHRFGSHFKDLPGNPNTFANDHAYQDIKEVHYSPNEVIVPSFLTDTLGTRAELAQYYQAISRLDQGLGGLVRVLKETGHWDDTLIVFIADQGMSFAGAKTTCYEPGLRCPCIIRSPDVQPQGVTCDALVSWIDVAPTILDYAGHAAAAKGMQGRSLLPLLDKQHVDGWDTVFASQSFHAVTQYYPMRVVRGRRYKLLYNIAYPLEFPHEHEWESSAWQSIVPPDGPGRLGQRTLDDYLHRPKFELYDLENDPDEVHNLADDPAYAEIKGGMVAQLKEWQKKTKDPWRVKWVSE